MIDEEKNAWIRSKKCAIEPIIGHLKKDYHMTRCRLKGYCSSFANVDLVVAVWGHQTRMREFCSKLVTNADGGQADASFGGLHCHPHERFRVGIADIGPFVGKQH